jgi:small-conductance mechanosensitive channel/CRP-like cAMP-binding protein
MLPSGVESVREFLLASAALAVFLASAPAGRRRLGWGASVLLALGLVPVLVAAIVPADEAGGRTVLLTSRFFILASLFHALVLIVGVSCWERIGTALPQIFLDVVRWGAALVALAVVLWEAGVEPGELFTGSAILTAALGFALKDTLGNVFAGLAIHAEHPFDLGDWIQYDANPAHVGCVVEVNWRATKVLTLDEAFVIIPNGQLAQASIRNFTKPDRWSRRSLFVVTPYGVSPQMVQRIILGAIRGSFGVLEHPAPSVVTNAFTERGVEHWVRLFTNDFDKRDRVDGMARDRIWFALARHGIEIPVATQQIRLTQLPPPEPVGREECLARTRDALSRVGVFSMLDADQLRTLAEAARHARYAAGEAIIRQGEPGQSLFVIEEGRVEVTATDPHGREAAVASLGPGDFFGEVSLLTGAPRSATVTAAVESGLLEIEKTALAALLRSSPGLAEQFGDYLEERERDRSLAIAATGAPPGEPIDRVRRILDFFGL